MKLLVAVETLNGIRMIRSIAITFKAPDPIPRSPEVTPAPNIIENPAFTP
jgi:hypothetical protein